MVFYRREYVTALMSGAGGVVFSVGVAILVANLLSVAERGKLQALLTLATMLAAAASLGVPYANAYFANKGRTGFGDGRFLPLYILLVLAGCIALGLFKPWLSLVYTLCFGLLFYFLERSKCTARLYAYSRVVAFLPLLTLALVALSALLGLRYEGVVLAYALANGLAALGLIYVGHKRGPEEAEQAQQLGVGRLKYALGYWASLLSGSLMLHIDKLYVLAFLSMGDMGVLAVIQTVAMVLNRLADRVATTYFVLSSAEQLAASRRSLLWLLALLLPFVYGAGLVVGEYLVPLVFSAKYAGFAQQTALVLVAALIGSAAWILGQQLNAGGRPHINIGRDIGSSLVFVGVAHWASFAQGLQLVCVALVAAAVFRFAYSFYFAR